MKKLLSALLCIAMLASFGVAVSAEEDSAAKQNALELFGFPLDPDSYDTQAIKKGTYPVSPKYDLFVDDSNLIKLFEGKFIAISCKFRCRLYIEFCRLTSH